MDEIQARFGSFGSVEVQGKKKQLDVGMAEPEFFECGSIGLRTGAANDQRRLGGFHECGRVAEIFCGHNVIAGAFQQSAEVGEQVAGAFDAQNFWRGRVRRSLGIRLAVSERVDGFFLGSIDMEHAGQFRGFKNFFQERGKLAKFQVAARGAQRADEANQGSEAAAIEEGHVVELKNKFLRFEGVLFDFELESASFVADNNPAAAANDDNLTAELRLQIKLHRDSARWTAS